METLVLDNGAAAIKVGTAASTQPTVLPNAIFRNRSRNFIGDQIDECTDFSSLYYTLPFERGFLTNWGVERTLWNRIFGHVAKINPKESRLMITEPCFNLPRIREAYDQVIFEEYGFNALYRATAAELCSFNDVASIFGDPLNSVPDCMVVVDSGYSFTHIVPLLKGKPIPAAVRRIDVGGKLLTNFLKESVSFRYYDMMEETYVINEVKEACCYVSQDVYRDLAICKEPYKKNSIVQEYVLPDYINSIHGHIRPRQEHAPRPTVGTAEQTLTMNNERFMIPELLMNPSDIGIQQAGIPEAIVESVSACDPELHGLLYANILLVGGNANLPGYEERIRHELTQMVPSEYDLRIGRPSNPSTFAWEGGQRFVSSSTEMQLKRRFVRRKEYEEYGSDACYRKLDPL